MEKFDEITRQIKGRLHGISHVELVRAHGDTRLKATCILHKYDGTRIHVWVIVEMELDYPRVVYISY
jgi:hypothetical protein